MEEKHGSVVKILENRLKLIWCSSCGKEKRADRLCQHLKVVNIQNTDQADNCESLSKPVKENPNIQEQDSQTNTQASSNLKSHGTQTLGQNKDMFHKQQQQQQDIHERCDKVIADKDKQLADLKNDKNSLQEKTERNESELIKLRAFVGGTKVVALRIELSEAKARLDEKDKQLNDVKTQAEKQLIEIKAQAAKQLDEAKAQAEKQLNEVKAQAEKQLNEMKDRLKEWIDTANNLINNKADFKEWKTKFKRISETNSAAQSHVHSQDNSNSPMIHTENEHSDQYFEMSETTKIECNDNKKHCGKDGGPKMSRQNQDEPKEAFKTEISKLVPLKNRGNTCYLNAALQVLQKLNWLKSGKNLFEQDGGVDLYKCLYLQKKRFNYSVQRDSAEVFLLIAEELELDQSFCSQTLLVITCRECNHTVKVMDNGILNLPVKSTLDDALEVLNHETNDLPDYSFCPTTKLQYELVAYVNHIGDLPTNGHYTTCVKQNSAWCLCDDNEIRTMTHNEELLQRGQAYYLLYAKSGQNSNQNFDFTQHHSAQEPSSCNETDNQSHRYYCSLCDSIFTSFLAKFQHYDNCVGLINHERKIKIELQKKKEYMKENEAALVQTVLDFKGGALQRVRNFVDIQRQLKIKFGDNFDAILELYKQIHDPVYFNPIKLELIAGPIGDSEGNNIYAQFATRENLVKLLGKRKRSTAQDERLVKMMKIQLKQVAGVSLSLKEKRVVQQETSNEYIKQYCKDLPVLEQCFIKEFQSVKLPTNFTKVGGVFCDGIILPRLRSLFKTLSLIKVYLRSKKLHVQTVVNAQGDKGWCYIRLQDSKNAFTEEFIKLLVVILDDLSLKYKEKKPFRIIEEEERIESSDSEEDEEEDELVDKFQPWNDVGIDENGDVYAKQVDSTQDLAGFFLSDNMKKHIDLLAKSLKMSLTRDYRSTPTCFQLIGEDERFKLYNKLVHLTESEQAKKNVSSNFKSLLCPSDEFYEKMEAAFGQALSRIEFSNYLKSKGALSFMSVVSIQKRIDIALEAVNKIKGIYYEVPFHLYMDTYWNSAQPVFIFSENMWQIIWARTAASRYAGQQTLGKCKDVESEIKNYGITGKWATVIDAERDKVYKVMKGGKNVMQIPIQSLNQKHEPKFQFPFNKCKRQYKYRLLDSDRKEIKLTLPGGEVFKGELSGQKNIRLTNKQNKRDQKQKEKQRKKEEVKVKGGIDVTAKCRTGIRSKHNFQKVKNETYIIVDEPQFSQCVFFSAFKGDQVNYCCRHCDNLMERKGKGDCEQMIIYN